MVDLSKIVDIEKIREEREQFQTQRMLNAKLSSWEEMARYISKLEEGMLDIQSQMKQDSEYVSGQIEAFQMIKDFIVNRVQLISPGHQLVKEQVSVAVMM